MCLGCEHQESLGHQAEGVTMISVGNEDPKLTEQMNGSIF